MPIRSANAPWIRTKSLTGAYPSLKRKSRTASSLPARFVLGLAGNGNRSGTPTDAEQGWPALLRKARRLLLRCLFGLGNDDGQHRQREYQPRDDGQAQGVAPLKLEQYPEARK